MIEIEDEAEDDTISVEVVTRKRTLLVSITLQNFMLQFQNATPKLLDPIRKIKDELQQNLNFKRKQTTIEYDFLRVINL